MFAFNVHLTCSNKNLQQSSLVHVQLYVGSKSLLLSIITCASLKRSLSTGHLGPASLERIRRKWQPVIKTLEISKEKLETIILASTKKWRQLRWQMNSKRQSTILPTATASGNHFLCFLIFGRLTGLSVRGFTTLNRYSVKSLSTAHWFSLECLLESFQTGTY